VILTYETGTMSIRDAYQQHGVETYYRDLGQTYTNPHAARVMTHIQRWSHLDLNDTLDLCCGTGIVTQELLALDFTNIIGCDPFLHEIYRETTGCECYQRDFKQLSKGAEWKHRNIICSFGLHLCPTSLVPNLCWSLSQIARRLIIIGCGKKPQVVHYQVTDEWYYGRVLSRVCEL